MGDVVNLNRYRKLRTRADAAAKAADNRATFGRTKADKQRELSEAERKRRELDGKRLDDPAN